MTFNLWADQPISQSWAKRREAVVALIQKYVPDVIGFQEAVLSRIEYLADALPEYTWYGVGREDGKVAGEFAPVFYRKSRLHPGRHMTRWLSLTPAEVSRDWGAACHRIATFCEFTIPEGAQPAFVFINTHLDHYSRLARIEGARTILQEIQGWDQERPVILTGDFNCSERSPAYQILISKDGGLSDAKQICEAPCEGPRVTWQGVWGTGIARQRLDYFFTRHFEVKHHVVLNEKSLGRYPSDHFPVYCDLDFRR